MRSSKIFFAGFLCLATLASLEGQQPVPGVVVGHSPPSARLYLGSPSLVILGDGRYIASYQEFGPGEEYLPNTYVAESTDRGKTWNQLASIRGLYWANLFVYHGDLYLLGVQMKVKGGFGPLVIRRSPDHGKTWTEPVDQESGLLRTDSEYHTAPVPVVFHNGRLFRAVEDRFPAGSGRHFRALVISAPVTTDLLKASSWTASNRLAYDPQWPGEAWLEGNVVVTPEGRLVNILRNQPEGTRGGKACMVTVSEYGERVSFDPGKGFLDFPGGAKKFTIRYDAVSNRYWSLTNYIPPEFEGGNPGRTRNTLALISSRDLFHWVVNRIVLQHPDVTYVGFQYADWQFDGNDLVALIRTAYPEPDGTQAHNCHDSNYIIFYRINDFRKSLKR